MHTTCSHTIAGVDTSEDVIEEYSAADEARERLASRAAATKTSAPPKRPPASTSTTQDSDAFALTDEERLAILLKAKAGISQEEIYGEVCTEKRCHTYGMLSDRAPFDCLFCCCMSCSVCINETAVANVSLSSRA